jgi:sodium-coupled monocarboxylate transporter 8/12
MSENVSSQIPKLKSDDVIKSLQQFGLLDYAIFALMLVISSLIGVYFGCQDRLKSKKYRLNRLNTNNGSEVLEYLVGGRNLQVLPVAISLIATFVNGVHILGIGAEIYLYGIDFVMISMCAILTGFFTYFVIIPVFHDLNIVSSYEYLELRFDERVRMLCSFVYLLSTLLWLPIIMFVPAIALSQVTDINIQIITLVVYFICIFYTVLVS